MSADQNSSASFKLVPTEGAKMAGSEGSPEPAVAAAAMSIPKPGAFDLSKFKSKRGATIANVETLLGALPHHKISGAKDWVRLHPDEDRYWSPELCFVSCPVKGQRQDVLHLADEELIMQYLSNDDILRFRLAVASKPDDVFFLAHVPSQNLDNPWNEGNLRGCELGKTQWVKLISRRKENVDGYKVEFARDHDAFPEPKWPSQSLAELIHATFPLIETEDHPVILRKIAAKQIIKVT